MTSLANSALHEDRVVLPTVIKILLFHLPSCLKSAVYMLDLEKGKQIGQVVQPQSIPKEKNVLDSMPTSTEVKKMHGPTPIVE